jgi:hypothetical protein
VATLPLGPAPIPEKRPTWAPRFPGRRDRRLEVREQAATAQSRHGKALHRGGFQARMGAFVVRPALRRVPGHSCLTAGHRCPPAPGRPGRSRGQHSGETSHGWQVSSTGVGVRSPCRSLVGCVGGELAALHACQSGLGREFGAARGCWW